MGYYSVPEENLNVDKMGSPGSLYVKCNKPGVL